LGSYCTEVEAQTIRSFVRARKARQRLELADRLEEARRDFQAIAGMIVSKHRPSRIYQWGSLMEGGMDVLDGDDVHGKAGRIPFLSRSIFSRRSACHFSGLSLELDYDWEKLRFLLSTAVCRWCARSWRPSGMR
jgi:hypothetical protein